MTGIYRGADYVVGSTVFTSTTPTTISEGWAKDYAGFSKYARQVDFFSYSISDTANGVTATFGSSITGGYGVSISVPITQTDVQVPVTITITMGDVSPGLIMMGAALNGGNVVTRGTALSPNATTEFSGYAINDSVVVDVWSDAAYAGSDTFTVESIIVELASYVPDAKEVHFGGTEAYAVYSGSIPIYGKEVFTGTVLTADFTEVTQYTDSKYITQSDSDSYTFTYSESNYGLRLTFDMISDPPGNPIRSGRGYKLLLSGLPPYMIFTVSVTLGEVTCSSVITGSNLLPGDITLTPDGTISFIQDSQVDGTLSAGIIGLGFEDEEYFVLEKIIVQAGDWT